MKRISALLLALMFSFIAFNNAFGENNLGEAIFSYSYQVNFSPSLRAYSFSLYKDGTIIGENHYLESVEVGNTEYKKISENWQYKIAEEYAQEMLMLINQTKLDDIPKALPIHVEDAPIISFNFNGKEFWGEGIYYYTLAEILRYRKLEYVIGALYNNRILNLYSGIKNIFARAGYDFNLYGFELSED